MAMLVYTDPSGRELTVPLGPDSPVVTIGRATDCTIRSNRKSVSRRHAEFRYINGRYEVVDMGSSNGTYLIINDERRPVVEPQPLAHNDEVWCGDFILRFYENEGLVQGAGMGGSAEQYAPSPEEAYGSHRMTHDFGHDSAPQAGGVQGGYQQHPQSGSFGGPPPPPPTGQQQQSYPQHNYGHQDGYNNPPESFRAPESPDSQQFYSQQDAFGQDAYGQDAYGQDGFGQDSFGQDPYSQQASYGSSGYNSPENSYGASGGVGVGAGSSLMEGSSFEYEESGSGGRNYGAGDELERLRAEKQSVEDLAARQAKELEDLRAELERLRTTAGGQDQERLSMELEAAQQERERLEKELRLTQGASLEVDEERQRADAAEQRLQEAMSKIDELMQRADKAEAKAQESEGLRSTLAAREQDVKNLEEELAELRREFREAQSKQASSDEVDSLRAEVERQERLLAEFERRSIDLQAALDEEVEGARKLRIRAVEQKEQIEALKDAQAALELMTTRHETAARELEEARQALEEATSLEADLRAEIDGLKQRVRLEKQRAKNADAANVEAMQEQIAALQAQLEAAGEESSQGMAAEDLSRLIEAIGTLDRVVDAIERTDLSPLSTVDRVRLQSAIRDTQPRKTLSGMLKIVEGD